MPRYFRSRPILGRKKPGVVPVGSCIVRGTDLPWPACRTLPPMTFNPAIDCRVRYKVLGLLLAGCPKLLEIRDMCGYTPLHRAAMYFPLRLSSGGGAHPFECPHFVFCRFVKVRSENERNDLPVWAATLGVTNSGIKENPYSNWTRYSHWWTSRKQNHTETENVPTQEITPPPPRAT